MPDRSCSVADCLRVRYARGYCRAHYGRLRVYGDARPDVPLQHKPISSERDDVAGRILARCVQQPNGCIEWTGHTIHGYGRITWRGREWQSHRAIWTALVAPIPDDDDWTIDHLCRNRACQNVKHMEVVTRVENTERGGGLYIAQIRNARRVACRQGHLYVDHAVIDKHGRYRCLPCKRATWARHATQTNARRKAKQGFARDCEDKHHGDSRESADDTANPR